MARKKKPKKKKVTRRVSKTQRRKPKAKTKSKSAPRRKRPVPATRKFGKRERSKFTGSLRGHVGELSRAGREFPPGKTHTLKRGYYQYPDGEKFDQISYLYFLETPVPPEVGWFKHQVALKKKKPALRKKLKTDSVDSISDWFYERRTAAQKWFDKRHEGSPVMTVMYGVIMWEPETKRLLEPFHGRTGRPKAQSDVYGFEALADDLTPSDIIDLIPEEYWDLGYMLVGVKLYFMVRAPMGKKTNVSKKKPVKRKKTR